MALVHFDDELPCTSNWRILAMVSLKNTMLDGKNQNQQKYSGGKVENGHFANTSSGHKSANEQLPPSISFVDVTEMTEDEWPSFFISLLPFSLGQ